MKAAGATTVGGLVATGTAAASEPSDCNCEGGFLDSSSACLSGRTGCTYCKIDSGDLPSVGTTCSVEGTDSATIERTSEACIEFSDPEDELCKIALKAGTGTGSCTKRDVADDTSGSVCTENNKGISNIQFEFHCEECPGSGEVEPGEECDYENDAISSTSFNCTEVSTDLAGVEEDCPVQLRLTFKENTSECGDVVVEDVTTNDPEPVDVPDCCTPETLALEDPAGNELDSDGSGFTEGECVNENLDGDDFDDEFCCNRASLEVTNAEDLECPVDATLSLADGGADCSVTPGPTQELSPENLSAEWTIEGDCGCEPSSIVVDGLEFEAPSLNCQCTSEEELCKIEAEDLFYDEEGDLRETPFTVDCSGVEITITEVRTKDDDEVTCFNFTSDERIFEVFVKGGGGRDAGNRYTWPCTTTDSTDPEPEFEPENSEQEYEGMLCSNLHPKNDKQTAVSHVTFYVCADELDYC